VDDLLDFLVANKYTVKIKGKIWWGGIVKIRNTPPVYNVGGNAAFSSSIVKSVTIFGHSAIVEFIGELIPVD
jgi:hypothetical protein